jgi:hypothetical protein
MVPVLAALLCGTGLAILQLLLLLLCTPGAG